MSSCSRYWAQYRGTSLITVAYRGTSFKAVACRAALLASLQGLPRSSEEVHEIGKVLGLSTAAPPLEPTAGLWLGPYGSPRGGGRFLMSEVPLYPGVVGMRWALPQATEHED